METRVSAKPRDGERRWKQESGLSLGMETGGGNRVSAKPRDGDRRWKQSQC